MDNDETIYDSPPSEPDDAYWLDQGKKLIEGSFAAVQEGAKSLMTGLGLLNTMYLGILGFSDFLPKDMPFSLRLLYLIPVLFWLIGLFCAMQVMMTREMRFILFSPDNIRTNIEQSLVLKQRNMNWSFWMIVAGLFSALMLIICRIGYR